MIEHWNMPESYPEFFHRITGHLVLPFQERYAADPFSPALLEIPTGLGKTDTALIPWLYAQVTRGGSGVPRRLFLVLPRQNLTKQTAENACRRREATGLSEDDIPVLELMGGSTDNSEKLAIDKPAIIVATQDLYFSRALNRGYARSAPHWPIDFALYNQDCLIVLDEIQLMDDALATSRQLDAFRQQFRTYGPAVSIWMSATLNEKWLQTVDASTIPRRISLEADDLTKEIVQQKYFATKSLGCAPEGCRETAGCAAFAIEHHRPGTRTLIVANTVKRAREIYRHVKAAGTDATLRHSRFRPADRERGPLGDFVIATQVLEAGVDITSRLMVTDAAPWGSLVQRFGRVNRYGTDQDAQIWWVDEPATGARQNKYAPYDEPEVLRAIARLKTLSSAAPADLPREDGPEPWKHVLRRSDLLDLFDTTPDLSGNDIDISRFIRATEDRDAYVAWRDFEDDPSVKAREIRDAELCPVPLGELRDFLKKHKAWVWNFATEEWDDADIDSLYPGMTVVMRCKEGGYTTEEGWSPESKSRVVPLPDKKESDGLESDSTDWKVWASYAQPLRAHTARVCEELEKLFNRIDLEPEHRETLRRSALLHDWGKAHPVFQKAMKAREGEFLAKQEREIAEKYTRKHFRHELASALAMFKTGESDLATYLAAAHHGKVRGGIRSMPGEKERGGKPVARGIVDGDRLLRAEVAPELWKDEIELSLAPMELGSGSWTEKILRLRDEIGPFRLAFLEAILRAADVAASEDPKLEATACTS